jgi:hypothetical protein
MLPGMRARHKYIRSCEKRPRLRRRCALVVLLALAISTGSSCHPIRGFEAIPGRDNVAVLREFGQVEVDENAPDHPVVQVALSGRRVSDHTTALLTQFPELRRLELHDVRVTDVGLRQIAQLPRLKYLCLDGIDHGDAGLAAVATAKSLESLSLRHVQMTQRGLEQLARLPHLHELDLYDVPIDDHALAALAVISQLRQLRFQKTELTNAGLSHFMRVRPGVVQMGFLCENDPAEELLMLDQRRLLRRGFTGRL